MTVTPDVIVFDVNETLSDMSSMGERFAATGAPAEMAKLWFATLLRDGFALAAAGDSHDFADIGADALTGLLRSAGVDDPEQAARRLVSSMADLPLHPDVPEGVRALHAAGHRLVTLSNGASVVAQRLLGTAGIRDLFEALLSVQDAGAWKPHRAAYQYAADRCAVPEQQMLLVAVHPWDIHGAARAGLRTAWINRAGSAYPTYFTPPDLTAASLVELQQLLDAPS